MVGGPKFRAFFALSYRKFHSLFSFWGLLVEFWWCLKRRDAQMCTFGVLWLSCEAPAARSGGATEVSHDSLRAPTCTFERPSTTIQREDPEREERKKFPAGERTERAKFWAVQGKAEGRSGGEDQNTPTTHTTTTTQQQQQQQQQQPVTNNNKNNDNNNNRKFRQRIKTPKLAKCGLVKCGHENKLAKFGFFWPNAVWPNAGMTFFSSVFSCI